MTGFWGAVFPAGGALLIAATVLVLGAFLVTNIRRARWLGALSGAAVAAHFAIVDPKAIGLALGLVLAGINAAQLAIMGKRSRSGALLDEERALFEELMSGDDLARQNRLRDLMAWHDVPQGSVLMTQGQANPPLIYVASGGAVITADGQSVGECETGDFLGEMSAISGSLASATVTVTRAMRYAQFDRDALGQMTREVPELGKALDGALNRSLAAKVLRMNKAATRS